MIFCDTSAVAKLYVPERETAGVRRLLESEDDVWLSELARVELMGVFHRRLREGKWARADFFAAVRHFSHDDLGGFWTWLPLSSAILKAAAATYATLPDSLFLRSADCLHLVTAIHHDFEHDFEAIYTYDRHQAAAAEVLGLQAKTAKARP